MSKKVLYAQVCSQGGSYVFVSGNGRSNHARISSLPQLHSFITSFAVEQGLSKVKVSGGRNIMDEDGPSAVFTVKTSIE